MREVLFQSNQVININLIKKEGLVTSKVDQAILKDIAEAGKGSFYWFSNNRDSYIDIENGINKMEKKIISTHEYAEYDDRLSINWLNKFKLLFSIFYLSNKREKTEMIRIYYFYIPFHTIFIFSG